MTHPLFFAVAFYDKNMVPFKVSRYSNRAAALKKIMACKLAGVHADFVGEDLEKLAADKLINDFRKTHALKNGVHGLPNARSISQAKVKTRVEGVYEIRTARVRTVKVKYDYS